MVFREENWIVKKWTPWDFLLIGNLRKSVYHKMMPGTLGTCTSKWPVWPHVQVHNWFFYFAFAQRQLGSDICPGTGFTECTPSNCLNMAWHAKMLAIVIGTNYLRVYFVSKVENKFIYVMFWGWENMLFSLGNCLVGESIRNVKSRIFPANKAYN